MIDLHLHLDGSLSPALVQSLAQKQNLSLPIPEGRSLAQALQVSEDCRSLNDYLACFDLPLLVLQEPDAVEEAFFDLCCRLKRQGLLYAEIRFAPQLHTHKGHTQTEIVEAAIKGISRSDFWAGLILCCMRGDQNKAANRETVEIAGRFLNQGVAAIDLAGAEALYPTADFSDLFAEASALHIPFTIHAGEAAGPDSVQSALSFGAVRIGHGLHSTESSEVMRQLSAGQVCLELCPTSNLQTCACPSLDVYPIQQFREWHIPITLNTDNMTVSGTDIFREHRLIQQAFSLTSEEMGTFITTAIQHAFLDADQKKYLLKLYKHIAG